MKYINRSNNHKIIFAATLIAALFFFSSTAFAKSQEQESLNSLLQNIAAKVGQISTIAENPDLPAEEKELEETRIRKEALSLIFDLTLLEDEGLKNKLNDLDNLNKDQDKIREKLLVIFTENENAYKEMRKRLAEAETLEEVKNLASDFKNWRGAVYNPKVEKVVSFVLIFRQKQILDIAWQRLEKIKADLERLEVAGLIKSEETEEFLLNAILDLETAQKLNQQAEGSLTSIITNELDPKKSGLADLESIKEDDEETPPTPRELVEQSLDNIRAAYGNFIKIGKLVKEKLSL